MCNTSCTCLPCRKLPELACRADSGVAGGVNENSLNVAGHPGVGMARSQVPKTEMSR
jgi:hypothetical protein